jgi:hypothetical protein
MDRQAFNNAHFLGQIRCRHATGELRVFEVRVEVEAVEPQRQWSFFVFPVEPPYDGDEIYFAGVKEVENQVVQLEATKNSLPETYHHCCITCSLVPLMAETLRSSVCSSRTPPAPRDRSGNTPKVFELAETRSEAASAVWKKMVVMGAARYDANTDRYFYDVR